MQPSERPPFHFRFENALVVTVLAVMAILPLIEIVGRVTVGRGISGSIVVVQNLTLWITVLGAVLAARSERLLALSTQRFLAPRAQRPVKIFTSAIAVAVTTTLVVASLDFVQIEREFGDGVAWDVPIWVVLAVLPIGFGAITGRLIWHAASDWPGRAIAAVGLLIPLAFTAVPETVGVVLPATLVIIASTALGMPIFTAIGGAALVLFWDDGTPTNAVPGETYRLTASPMLPAIPLFALAGYLLAEGSASRRLTRLFTACVGWMPGGLAIVATLVLAFFTPLTGASGITILSMGGLLLPVLVRAKYPEQTSLGLVTVSGSIGLLWFPSLPVFLYGFYANIDYAQLFVGGLLPGILLVVVVAGWGASQGWLRGVVRTPFVARDAMGAIWEAKWELLLPGVVLGGIAGGYTTLVEAAALTVLYTFVVECFIQRGLSVRRDLPRIFVECGTLIGGFMIILSVALGFTNFLIIAEIPTMALDWVQAHIESPMLFLLALNAFLILVGAMMDIYSAIVVVVPLIAPIAAAYGIDPVHLGIVFLANMELGYLMPPMGENLFLSSYRFDKPLTEVYRSTLPYTLLLLGAVLLITYVPGMTLWLVRIVFGPG
ncbi:MAG: TRAP transporter large permease subunit [Vicinamibacterales bacterium]|jgi:tripartite ATP-independent transporter DctM subunit|nr:TRAP transporter large permease subunit [Vicinamibacterales bacterium]HJO38402.1 TRAP transporter large permease subunit [Vicinamibacterales bacterium]|tara:strand:- start:602 stop:2413 length:1812 start_codon:yes stop_codon:yes gene_type:complete